jgi:PAS domain S-box-containing protein
MWQRKGFNLDSQNIRVLLLENDASHAEAIRCALQSSNANFKVQVACSLREYRDSVAAGPPDIALLNMVMSDGRSLELVSSPPEANPFPILMMASRGDEKTAVSAMKAGALDYVVKSPQAFAVMPRILSRALSRWQLIQERKRTEEALRESEQSYRRLSDYHKRLNEISISFIEAVDTPDLFNRIAETFRLLTGAIAATFSIYNQGPRDLKVVSLSIDPVLKDKVSSIFGPGMFEMHMPVSAEVMEQMLSQVVRRPQDLRELSFGVIPQDVSDAIMDAAGCRQIVALAISYAEELVGTCIAYLPGDQPVVPDDALKTYAYTSGLTVNRRRAEEALNAGEAQYRLLAEHTTDFVWLMDMNLKPTYQSPSAEKLTGFTQQEIMELPLEKRVTAESLKFASAVFLEELAKVEADPDYNPVRILELEYCCKDGTTAWAENKFSIIRDPDGKAVSIMGEARDVTERKQAEKELRDSEEKYRMVVENSLESIYIAVDGMIKFSNNRTAEISGYSQEELISIPFSEFIHPDDLQLVAERHSQRLNGMDAPSVYSFRIVCKSGDIKWVELAAVLITWEGKPAILNFLNDVTDRRRLEEERQRVEKLESVGLLAGGIAHDFNNILTSILGNISLASMEAAPGSELQNSLQKAEKASLRAKDLNVQLLTFSKGGAPVKTLASVPELLKDTVSFALRGSNVKCHFSLPADLWQAEIDAGQVSQVMHNLVINAQQAMPTGGSIELRADNMAISETRSLGRGLPIKAGNYIRIAVADHGSGIPAEHLARIFDPYFTTKRKGTGLGLATSFSIARNHGGHLSVESELGAGSTFYLYLPASTQTSAPRQAKKVAIKAEGQARILVMDDEEEIREVAGRMLKHIGYENIEFAADGAEAIKLYKAAMKSGHPFSAVILDLTIPGGMGGKETVQNLLKIDPWVKAIVSSGYADESAMAEYRGYGFSGMAAKPYTFDKLRQALFELMGRRSSTDK